MKFNAIGIVVVFSIANSHAKLAPVLRACRLSDPQYEICVKGVIESIRPAIASGDFGAGHPRVPSLEPFEMARLEIDHGAKLRVKLTNSLFRGLGGFVLRRVSFNKDEKMINITLRVPTITIKGQYDLNMNVAVMKVYGKGDYTLNLDNTAATLKATYFVEKDQTVQFRQTAVKLRFDKVRVQLKNLFNGDKALEKLANDAVNQTPAMLLDEIGPDIEVFLGKHFTEIANTVIGGATEQELLPP